MKFKIDCSGIVCHCHGSDSYESSGIALVNGTPFTFNEPELSPGIYHVIAQYISEQTGKPFETILDLIRELDLESVIHFHNEPDSENEPDIIEYTENKKSIHEIEI